MNLSPIDRRMPAPLTSRSALLRPWTSTAARGFAAVAAQVAMSLADA